MSPPWADLIQQTLARQPEATRTLIEQLYPLVQTRVARVLSRGAPAGSRNVRQEVADMTQDVFRFLFDEGGRALRAWAPERGLSLPNYVGLLAERHAISVLRSDRRNPWTEDPTLDSTLDRKSPAIDGPEPAVVSKDLWEALLDKLKVALSPLGLQLFELLYVEERSVEEVAASMNMSTEAVYAWRSRLRRLVATLAAELSGPNTPAPERKEAASHGR